LKRCPEERSARSARDRNDCKWIWASTGRR